MQDLADKFQLPPRWWWGSAAAVFVVALIFLAIGSAPAALACLAFAILIALLARAASPVESSGTPKNEPAKDSR